MLLSTPVIRMAPQRTSSLMLKVPRGSLPRSLTAPSACLAQSKCIKRTLHLYLFRTPFPQELTSLTILLLIGPQMAKCHPPILEAMRITPIYPAHCPPLGKGPSWPNVVPASLGKDRCQGTLMAIQPKNGVILQLGQHSL